MEEAMMLFLGQEPQQMWFCHWLCIGV